MSEVELRFLLWVSKNPIYLKKLNLYCWLGSIVKRAHLEVYKFSSTSLCSCVQYRDSLKQQNWDVFHVINLCELKWVQQVKFQPAGLALSNWISEITHFIKSEQADQPSHHELFAFCEGMVSSHSNHLHLRGTLLLFTHFPVLFAHTVQLYCVILRKPIPCRLNLMVLALSTSATKLMLH